MAKKKTTLMLDESLYQQARIRAAETNRSVSDFVAEALKAYVSAPGKSKKEINIPISSARGGWLPRQVDPSSNVQVADYLDEIDEIPDLKC